MKNIFTLLCASTIALGSIAQVNVPQTTKALYNKKTASWCPPCGDWGLTVNNDIEAATTGKAVVFKLTASNGGMLYSSVCEDLYAGFDNQGASGWPNFYVNAKNETVFGSSGGVLLTSTPLNVISSINSFYNATSADANAGYIVTQTADSVIVDVTTEFFTAMSGDYYTAVYILENNISYSQAGVTGIHTASHFMRASLAGNTSFGAAVGTGSVAAGTVVNGRYAAEIQGSWNASELHVITVVWKYAGAGMYDVINSNDVESSSTVGVSELALQKNVVYPNPTNGMITVETKWGLTETIKVYNLLGEKVAEANVNSLLTTIDISNLTNGIYFVEMIDKNNVRSLEKVIKQ
tara:strand:+ start:1079 stop:2128 length:1050 start_codon:yes stop_codon:yes gene_type:complete